MGVEFMQANLPMKKMQEIWELQTEKMQSPKQTDPELLQFFGNF